MALAPALVHGATERVRPILMTSLTTICGLLPLVLFAESANANIWNALGFALRADGEGRKRALALLAGRR